MKKCNECESLEYSRSSAANSDTFYGGASFSCKEGYFHSLPFPMQPTECKNGIPPHTPFTDELMSTDTDYTLNNSLKCPEDCKYYRVVRLDQEDYCKNPDLCARHCFDLYEKNGEA